jgi:preprotein translocase subunit SecD
MRRRVRRALLAFGVLLAPVLPAAPAQGRPEDTIEFRPVLGVVAPASATPSTTGPVDLSAANRAVASCRSEVVAQLPIVPTTSASKARPGHCVVFPDDLESADATRYYLGPASSAIVRGIADARARQVVGQGWTVRIHFTRAGSKAWDHLGRLQFHQQLAITMDGFVISAPTVQPELESFESFGGTAVVSGRLTQDQARAVAATLRSSNGG